MDERAFRVKGQSSASGDREREATLEETHVFHFAVVSENCGVKSSFDDSVLANENILALYAQQQG